MILGVEDCWLLRLFSNSCSASSLWVGDSTNFTDLEVGDVGVGPLLRVGGGDIGGEEGADNTGG